MPERAKALFRAPVRAVALVRHDWHKGCSQGQNIVELALVLPILIMIFAFIIDFSRLYHGYVSATNAARVGAELATNVSIPNLTVVSSVEAEASPAVTVTNIAISPTVRTSGSPVQIGVTYVFSPYTPLVSGFWGGGSLPLVVTATASVY